MSGTAYFGFAGGALLRIRGAGSWEAIDLEAPVAALGAVGQQVRGVWRASGNGLKVSPANASHDASGFSERKPPFLA